MPSQAEQSINGDVLKTSCAGHYFDGRTSTRHSITVVLFPRGLELRMTDSGRIWWPYAELNQAQGGDRDDPVRLERGTDFPEALVVEDPAFLLALRRIALTVGDRFRPPTDPLTAICRILVALLPCSARLG